MKKATLLVLVSLLTIINTLSAAPQKNRLAVSCWLDRSVRMEITAVKNLERNDWTVKFDKIHFMDGIIDSSTVYEANADIKNNQVSIFTSPSNTNFINITLTLAERAQTTEVDNIQADINVQVPRDDRHDFSADSETICEMLR